MKRLNIKIQTLPYLVIAILLGCLFFKGCNSAAPTEPVTITIPEKTGTLPALMPIQKPIVKDSIVYRDSIVYVANPINTQLLSENAKLKDSFNHVSGLQKSIMYDDAIKLNEFTYNSEDSNLQLEIKGKVRGSILDLKPIYTIKEQSVTTTIKQASTRFRLLLGGEVGNTTMFNSPLFKANAMLQNAKGNILSISYGTEKRVYVGYNFTVFKVNK